VPSKTFAFSCLDAIYSANVRGVNTRKECDWLHACKSFKRAGVGTNGILACKSLSKNAHRAAAVKLALTHTVCSRVGQHIARQWLHSPKQRDVGRRCTAPCRWFGLVRQPMVLRVRRRRNWRSARRIDDHVVQFTKIVTDRQVEAVQRNPRFTFSVWAQFTVPTGKRSEYPRGMPLVTRVLASSEQAWEPMASLSVKFFRKRASYRWGSVLAQAGAGVAWCQI
jgi:hypothetical protein